MVTIGEANQYVCGQASVEAFRPTLPPHTYGFKCLDQIGQSLIDRFLNCDACYFLLYLEIYRNILGMNVKRTIIYRFNILKRFFIFF